MRVYYTGFTLHYSNNVFVEQSYYIIYSVDIAYYQTTGYIHVVLVKQGNILVE